MSTESWTYDDAGRVLTSTDIYGLQTQNTYNRFGQLVETRKQAHDQNNALVWVVNRTVYDSYGRELVATDAYVEGSSQLIMGTQTSYDLHGRAYLQQRLQGVVVALSGGDTSVTSAGTVLWTTPSGSGARKMHCSVTFTKSDIATLELRHNWLRANQS